MIPWRPEPASCWIAWVPRHWPPLGPPSTDLARRRLASWRAGDGAPADLSATPPDDVAYLPPLPPALERLRAPVHAWASSRGAVPLEQRGTERLVAERAARGAFTVWDPLASLLRGELDWCERLPAGAQVVWPLVAGLTDDRGLFAAACRRLADGWVAVVQPMALELDAADRRRLYEACAAPAGDAYARLFHGEPVSERDYDRIAREVGLRTLVPRPALAGATRAAQRNRSAAVMLAETGELMARAGASEARVAPFFRAARVVDRLHLAVDSLARDGNLALVPGLEPGPLQSLAEWLAAAPRSEDCQ